MDNEGSLFAFCAIKLSKQSPQLPSLNLIYSKTVRMNKLSLDEQVTDEETDSSSRPPLVYRIPYRDARGAVALVRLVHRRHHVLL